MTLISKSAGTLSLISCIRDIHNTAKIYATRQKNKASADSFSTCAIGTSKADYISYKDAERKNWLMRKGFFSGLNETLGLAKGYLKGVRDGVTRYLPNFILSAIAIIPKSKTIANIAAVGLGIVEACDFVNNASGINEKTDYLKL